MTRRGATGLAGVLLVDKPQDMTSHDVVTAMRRATGEGRVGHAGTLDPMATGLLVVLLGPYTRLAPYLSGRDKAYEATIAFGESTDTDDAEGAVLRSLPIPDDVFSLEFARRTLEDVLGESMQTPPAYSAIKVGGTAAHRAARAGEPLELAPRPIVVRSAELHGIRTTPPAWDVGFVVSKGTYIRALARDIGVRCGTVAHLTALRRTASGRLDVADALPLAQAVSLGVRGELAGSFADIGAALEFAVIGLDAASKEAIAVSNGGSIPLPAWARALRQEGRASVLVGGRFAAVYRRSGESLVAEVVVGGRDA